MIPVCTEDDVPMGEGRAVTVAGRRIAVFRTQAGWWAVDQACPHAGGPLADGLASDCTVICPLHERRFRLDTGAAVGLAGPGVVAHEVEVAGGEVRVRLAPTPAAVAA